MLPFATCALALSTYGQRAGWCVSEPEGSQRTGDFFVVELVPNAQPTPVTQGAGRCGNIMFAPDGSGVVYLANYDAVCTSDGPEMTSTCSTNPADAEEMVLWWAPSERGVPPLQLSPPHARILNFGWAPPVEVELEDSGSEEEDAERGERGMETGPVMRLWVTFQRGERACTQLLDIYGTMLGSFELPVTGSAVAWLRDGRRVMVTESESWFPSLWDGATLHALPMPAGFDQITISEESWWSMAGRRQTGVVYSLRGTPFDAPIIVVRSRSSSLPTFALIPSYPPHSNVPVLEGFPTTGRRRPPRRAISGRRSAFATACAAAMRFPLVPYERPMRRICKICRHEQGVAGGIGDSRRIGGCRPSLAVHGAEGGPGGWGIGQCLRWLLDDACACVQQTLRRRCIRGWVSG